MARKQGSHSDITGPRIRAAALRLFAREGYAAVSMRQIAAEVDVQAGALYKYTPDKQTLLFDLMYGHMHEILAVMPEGPADPVARLDVYIRFHLEHHQQRRDEIFLAYNELRSLNAENFAKLEQLRRAYETRFETALRDGAARGVMRVPEPRVTAMAIIALLTGFNTWYRPEGRLGLAELQDIYCDLGRGLAGVAQAAHAQPDM